jgi:hypothetical protein
MIRALVRTTAFLACLASLSVTSVAFSNAHAAHVAAYTMEGFAFVGPSEIPAGMTTLSVTNRADRDDLYALISIGGGRSLEDFFTTMGMLFSGELSVVPDWIHFHGGSPIGPEQTREYTIFLGPGTYYLLSIEGDEEGPFAARGALLPVTASAAGPEADVTITLSDYEFSVEGTLVAGSQIVRVVNSANQPHELLILPLPPGVSLDDMLAAEGEHGEHAEGEGPPEEGPSSSAIRGLWALDPAKTAYVTIDLEPGTYGIVCFIPDADGPHAMQGMRLEVTVD